MRQKYALVCTPADTVASALRMQHLGEVSVPRLKRQHDQYLHALQSFGYTLITLPPDPSLPDSTFVEDPTINIDNQMLVVARLENAKRRGEEERMLGLIKPLFEEMPIARIVYPGMIEGGDVLVADGKLYIGISKRTNTEGAVQLERIAHKLGWSAETIPVPSTYLHLKGEATYHPEWNCLTVSEEIAGHFEGSGLRMIVTPKEERFAGNCISHGNQILIHKGSIVTAKLLRKEGFEPIALDLSEFAKIDGAMTCLSKFFSP